jgi:CheY-like chemotaxis protein
MTERTGRDSVLLIDDDPDFRSLVETIAQMWNVTVLHAEDCKNGMEILEREQDRIKMIFLDYFMPGMPPAGCAASLIAESGKEIPIVLVTAAADPAARAAELNLSRWLSKPFEVSDLEVLLREP